MEKPFTAYLVFITILLTIHLFIGRLSLKCFLETEGRINLYISYDSMNTKELTKKYNARRKTFSFPTVPAAESAIVAILDMYPEIKKLSEDEQIKRIAEEISLISFF